MINAGHQNFINHERVITVVDFTKEKPQPVKRSINTARQIGTLIDITNGKATNSVIFMESGYIVLSSLSGEVISKRIQEAQNNAK